MCLAKQNKNSPRPSFLNAPHWEAHACVCGFHGTQCGRSLCPPDRRWRTLMVLKWVQTASDTGETIIKSVWFRNEHFADTLLLVFQRPSGSCVFIDLCVYLGVCVGVRVLVCVCLHECVCVCMSACVCVYMCVWMCRCVRQCVLVCSFYLKSRIIQGIMDTYVYACICIYTLWNTISHHQILFSVPYIYILPSSIIWFPLTCHTYTS